MNDFTKEELQLLAACVFSKFIASLGDPSIQHYQPDLKNIRNKIEFMIDSYCEQSKYEREIRNLVELQSSPGNYNCNPYMWGLANGLILALSCITGKCDYLEKPKIWLDDLPKADIVNEICNE
jgi:hypothetical protein